MLMDGKFRFGQRIHLSYEYKLLTKWHLKPEKANVTPSLGWG